MKVYIGISWGALDYGKAIARSLEQHGHVVTSHYLAPEFDPTQDDNELDPRHAARDIVDLECAEVFLHVTGSGDKKAEECRYAAGMLWPNDSKRGISLASTSGGRHVEHGIAFQMGLVMMVLGPIENCFQAHTVAHRFDYITDVVAQLDRLERAKTPREQEAPRLPNIIGIIEREAETLIERHGQFESGYTGSRCIVNATNELVNHSCVEPRKKDHNAMRWAAIKVAAQAARFAVQCCGRVAE